MTSPWIAALEALEQKASHCLRWLASFVVFPGSDAHAPGHPHDVKENAIQQSSIGPCFWHWTGVNMGPLTGLWLCIL